MLTTAKLLLENRAWSHDMQLRDPDYFSSMLKGQSPELLWIGCSDSRVPAETVVNAQPGEIFVHRNIANQVIATDFNCLSVLQYAISVLKVKHVIVCGHYGCGGVIAAMQSQNRELLITNNWLLHIKNIYRLHQDELDDLESEKKIPRLIELNIIEQVYRLAHTAIIQTAWREGHKPTLHGWVYGMDNGLLNELIMLDHDAKIEGIYRYTD